jgi:RNA polymerase sigma-70 factor, ECF subfamily
VQLITHAIRLPSARALAGFAAVAWRVTHARGDDEDALLLERLRAGDEDAFLTLVSRHQGSMLRLARSFVPSAAVAEEVVQDTWLGVVKGIDAFAGRSSIRTWLLAILVNRARSTGVSERRSVAIEDVGPVVDAARFDASGAWASPPRHWVEEVEERMQAEAARDLLRGALDGLPGRQREVVTLRDVDGLTSEEVCAVLQISEGNQRVLLHRGRSRLREALEVELEGC